MKTWVLFLLAGLLSPMLSVAQEPEQMGSWYYQASLDPITDLNTSSAFTVDDDEEWVLGVNCMDGAYWVGIMIHPTSMNGSMLRLKMLMETWQRAMTWRIDQGAPVTEKWLVAESGLAVKDKSGTRFTEAIMLASERVALRFGHSTKTYTEVLAVDGAAEAIGALNGCN